MVTTIENDAALQQTLAALEADRVKISSQLRRDLLFTAIAFVGLSVGYFVDHIIIGAVVFSVFIIIMSVGYKGRKDKLSVYKERYKREIISSALKYIDPNLTFDPHSGVSAAEFNYCQLFYQSADRFRTEDMVMGTAGKTAFYFSEVMAEYKKEYENKNGTISTSYYEFFKGMVFVADFNKNFNHVTVIKPKLIGIDADAWETQHMPLFARENIITLENPEFNKTFATYCSDQVEARYILTPAMMERILKLNKQAKKPIKLSFIGSRMYIVFPIDKDYFEAPIHQSLFNPATLYADMNLIKFMYDIVAELDLNTRIWGKE